MNMSSMASSLTFSFCLVQAHKLVQNSVAKEKKHGLEHYNLNRTIISESVDISAFSLVI